MRTFTAEFIGTFFLVLIGTGAIVVNDISGGIIGHLGISIAFGGIVTLMVMAFGQISGAHINPAVTLAFWAWNKFEGKKVLPYLIAQLLGALLASTLLWAIFDHENLGSTQPAGSVWISFALEILLTFLLMMVIVLVVANQKSNRYSALAIGGIVFLDAYFGGPICGASMNPARSIGPAMIAGKLDHLWIYILAPILGATLSIISWKLIKK